MSLRIVFATNNQRKIDEIQHLMGNHFMLLSPTDIGCTEEIPENQSTLEGNAFEKVRFIYKKYQMNCFADDTGLEIEALKGEPGVFSARYAGSSKDPAANMAKVLSKLADKKNRRARFRTVIALILDGKEYSFEGIVRGRIIRNGRGNKGFGYDPIFLPDGYDKTFAEMNLDEKNKISHRGVATMQLVNFLKNLN